MCDWLHAYRAAGPLQNAFAIMRLGASEREYFHKYRLGLCLRRHMIDCDVIVLSTHDRSQLTDAGKVDLSARTLHD